ncbi:MAG: DUF6531 domain-containing protein, partial [Pirellulales bacterium]|nr:DUF6531 domain-containing protein [Pirellulales bacterium]
MEDASDSPVKFSSGEVLLSETDISAAAAPFAQQRTYSNRLAGNYEGPLGNNWLVPTWPYLVQETAGSDSVLIFVRGQTRIWFDKSGATFTARYGGEDRYTLTHSGTVFTLKVQSDHGLMTYQFNDFSAGADSDGLLKSQANAYDETITAHSYDGPAIAELRSTHGGTIWSMLYGFYPSGAHTGRVQYATLRKSTDSGSTWTDIRRAKYDYYTGNEAAGEAHGTSNDLKLVTTQVKQSGNWEDVSKSYYRWYKLGETGGFEGGLKYVVGPQAYADMLADNLTPESASNNDVAAYADHYFEYDTDKKVTKEIASGGGGGTGASGETMTRSQSAHSDSYNHWKFKVVLTKANGNVETVYTNYLGQTMVRELKESSASSR